MAKRVFLVVLDSFGVGAEPDADKFGDVGANTLASIAASIIADGSAGRVTVIASAPAFPIARVIRSAESFPARFQINESYRFLRLIPSAPRRRDFSSSGSR